MAFYRFVPLICYLLQRTVFALPADIPNVPNCIDVKPMFETRNVSSSIPNRPVNGNSLSVCKSDLSCCTSEMESNLMTLVKKEYHSLLQQNAQSVQGILASTAIHFQEYVHQMMIKVENKTLRLFHDVFGAQSELVDNLVRKFFTDLNNHLDNRTNVLERHSKSQFDSKNGGGGDGRLSQITGLFFVRIFPYMYQTTLSQNKRELHPEYQECLRQHMSEIFPIQSSRTIKLLEKDLTKTLDATKVLIVGLEFGAQALNSTNLQVLSESSFNTPQCYEKLLQMTYCSHCNGHPASVKPCSGYCLNVMRGCLAQQSADLDSFWSGFYESLDRLISTVNRGQSLVCLEDLLRTLHSRIAEPMLSFMEQSEHVHAKAKFICGQTKWATNFTGSVDNVDEGKEKLGIVPGVTLTKLPGGHPEWSIDEDDANFRATFLTKKIDQFKESVPQSKAFYSNLADVFCADDSFAETRESAPCWNGQRVAEYTKTVLPISITSQKYNPELPLTNQIVTDPRITDLVENLRQMKQLVQSHILTNPESDSLYQMTNDEGSGSGGSPMSPNEWSDDEDGRDWPDQGSGSGEVPSITDMPEGKVETKVRSGLDIIPVEENPSSTPSPKPGNASQFKSNVVLLIVGILLCWRHL